MGMFDWVEFEGNKFQSKDTPRQLCDNYLIDEHGGLWVEEYDSEWIEDVDALFGGYLRQSNQRWNYCGDFTGTLKFYRENKELGGYQSDAWIEYEAEFELGQMINIQLLAGDHFIEWYRHGIDEKGLE